jgi:hypothetical protein
MRLDLRKVPLGFFREFADANGVGASRVGTTARKLEMQLEVSF